MQKDREGLEREVFSYALRMTERFYLEFSWARIMSVTHVAYMKRLPVTSEISLIGDSVRAEIQLSFNSC